MRKFVLPVFSVMCLFTAACSDGSKSELITPFCLDKTYYEVRLERNATSISVTNGSGDISLAIEDENILEAIYVRYNGGREKETGQKGHINLYGLQKGSTTLTIADNITSETETVEVKVTDCYLAYAINDSNHPGLEAGTTLFLVNNPARKYYLFKQDNTSGKPVRENRYEFFVTQDSGTASDAVPNLRLYNPYAAEGENADDCNAIPEFYDFEIAMHGEDASSSNVLQVVQAYLGVDWEELMGNPQTKSPAPVDMTMIMTVPDTDYHIRGVLSTVSIPEHILE